jgi:hypothetical protein
MNLPLNHPSLPPSNLSTYPHATLDLPPMSLSGAISPFAPSMASIFPRFAYADINVLIYLFGWRYRRLLTPRFIEGKVGEGEELAKRRGASAGGVGDREGDQVRFFFFPTSSLLTLLSSSSSLLLVLL